MKPLLPSFVSMILIPPMLALADSGITFTNIVPQPESGLAYRRTASATEAVARSDPCGTLPALSVGQLA